MNIKYPLDSDFVDSYLNEFIIRKFFPGNTDIVEDATLFKNCVHLNPSALRLVNCSDRRDKVNEYIKDKGDSFNDIKTKIVDSCLKELAEAHSFDKTIASRTYSKNSYKEALSAVKLAEKENSLENCYKNLI